ncbi:hypothetical protein VTL71DRAFT_2102 [Oculimacula yallundae]|uniref:Uncharacterized protein n=1 Tax=Oculimacula yallundae TaxID=86028 RepID=A0ABR4C9U6_9HELO
MEALLEISTPTVIQQKPAKDTNAMECVSMQFNKPTTNAQHLKPEVQHQKPENVKINAKLNGTERDGTERVYQEQAVVRSKKEKT